MELRISGGRRLTGRVTVQGSKNAGQKILPAIAALSVPVEIKNCSLVDDNRVLLSVLEYLGAKIEYDGNNVRIDPSHIEPKMIPRYLTSGSTGTFVFAGAMLRRFGYVSIGGPGGDQIGSRPVDFHLRAFEAMGAKCKRSGDYYEISAQRLVPTAYEFPRKSANGTVNAAIVASGTNGATRFTNVDRDPDIDNFVELMRTAGAVMGYDDDGSLIVTGTPNLNETSSLSVTMVPDRNDTATLLVACSLIGEDVILTNVPPLEQLKALVDLLAHLGAEIEFRDDEIRISRLDPCGTASQHMDIYTDAFPGLSTDWGPLVQVLISQAKGDFKFTETVFSQRFAHLTGLAAMGANIRYLGENLHKELYRFPVSDGKPHSVQISGPRSLTGATVSATDIRAAAALAVAGLVAEGETTIKCAEHLRRGYENLPERWRQLGAEISDYLLTDSPSERSGDTA